MPELPSKSYPSRESSASLLTSSSASLEHSCKSSSFASGGGSYGEAQPLSKPFLRFFLHRYENRILPSTLKPSLTCRHACFASKSNALLQTMTTMRVQASVRTHAVLHGKPVEKSVYRGVNGPSITIVH